MAINQPPYIINDLYAKRYYNAPATRVFMADIVRILKANQSTVLAEQGTVDSLTLPVIPDDKFFIGQTQDPNALACHVVGRQRSKTTAGSKETTVTLFLVITTEAADPVTNYALADSYITAFEALLETYALLVPKEFSKSWAGGSRINAEIEIVSRDITDGDALLRKLFGILPLIEITLIYNPAIN